MQTLEEKKIVIKLPQIKLRSFLSIRFGLILGLLLFSCAFAYWYRNVRPYLTIATAHINAYSTVLSSDQAGRIVDMGPQEGDRVKKGAFLFSLNTNSSQSAMDHLQREIEYEKEQMIKAMEGYLAATNDVELGIGEQENVQKHLNFLEEGQIKTAAIQKEIDALQAELKSGSIFAPFDGVILRRYKNEAEVCSVGDRVYSLCDLERLWVEAEVPETEIGKISIGTPARVKVNAYPKKELVGKVCYIGSATAAKSDHLPMSREGATIPIKIALECRELSLKPGLSAKVDLKVH